MKELEMFGPCLAIFGFQTLFWKPFWPSWSPESGEQCCGLFVPQAEPGQHSITPLTFMGHQPERGKLEQWQKPQITGCC